MRSARAYGRSRTSTRSGPHAWGCRSRSDRRGPAKPLKPLDVLDLADVTAVMNDRAHKCRSCQGGAADEGALVARREARVVDAIDRSVGRGKRGVLWGTLSRPMEAARFERTVRPESSEIFAIYGGARRVGRLGLHYRRFGGHGTLLLGGDLTADELQQIIGQIDEEVLQTHHPRGEGFLVPGVKTARVR